MKKRFVDKQRGREYIDAADFAAHIGIDSLFASAGGPVFIVALLRLASPVFQPRAVRRARLAGRSPRLKDAGVL